MVIGSPDVIPTLVGRVPDQLRDDRLFVVGLEDGAARDEHVRARPE